MTGGLVGRRDPAQPLLTYLDGPSRVELSGATTRNWVSKTANLLVDGFAGPERVGLLLPLHWQTLCLLLGTVASGATAVIARTAADLTGCALAFTESGSAEAALDVGVDDVLACSLTPFATRLANVPAMVLDAAAEIPAYSAQIVPKFANSNPITARYPAAFPQRSRMMPTKPLPLPAPILTAIS